MEWIILVLIVALIIAVLFAKNNVVSNEEVINLRAKEITLQQQLREAHTEMINMQDDLGIEREKNRELLSQKKSSETRLGQISEHLVPFLQGCPYNPKDLHFLANPIDYVVFDLDQGEITFLEIKTGNSKQSKRQKLIKNIIKAGRVYFAEMRIDPKGVKHKRYDNTETSVELPDAEKDKE